MKNNIKKLRDKHTKKKERNLIAQSSFERATGTKFFYGYFTSCTKQFRKCKKREIKLITNKFKTNSKYLLAFKK